MKKNRQIALILCLALAISTLTFASDQGIVKLQGVVMSVDSKKNVLIVNERLFSWDQHTLVGNENGFATTMEKVRVKNWVYVEGLQEKTNRPMILKKIYLLPNYVPEKERSRYPFFE